MNYDPDAVNASSFDDLSSLGAWTRIVFQSFRDGNWEIYVAMGDGSQPQRLTYNAGADVRPRLNADGSKIVFSSDRDGDWEIYTMNADGTDLRQLTHNSVRDTYAAWSPDGSRIAYSSQINNLYRLLIMNADGTGVYEPFPGNMNRVQPAWYPDGTRIAWVDILDSTTGALWSGHLASGMAWGIVSRKYLQNPVYSPNGYEIAFDGANDQDWNRLEHLTLGNTFPTTFMAENYSRLYDQFMGSWAPDVKVSNGIFTHILYTEAHYVIIDGRYYVSEYIVYEFPDYRYEPKVILGTGLDAFPDWKQIDFAPPVSQVNPLPTYSQASNVLVSWFGADQGPAGLKDYTVHYRLDACCNNYWTTWKTDTQDTTDLFPGWLGAKVYFRSQARDMAGNVEAWPANDGWDAFTTIYSHALSGHVTENRGIPMPKVPVVIAPQPVLGGETDLSGNFSALLAYEGVNKLTLNVAGYTSQADVPVLSTADASWSTYLFPPITIPAINNGGFEDTFTQIWQFGGDIPGQITTEHHQMGSRSAQLRAVCEYDCEATPAHPVTSKMSQQITVPDIHEPTLAFMYAPAVIAQATRFEVHIVDALTDTVVFSDTRRVFYGSDVVWRHGWADLSDWVGHQVTLQFVVSQGEKLAVPEVFVDSVTIAPWLTPVIETITPAHLDTDVTTAITVTGQNFLDPVTIYLDIGDSFPTVPTAITRLDAQTLIVDLPALGPNIYDLLIANPGGQQSVRVGAVAVGRQSYLPLAAR